MNSNNDPKQCTVPKLGRVHSAHTQNPSSAHSALSRAHCAVSLCAHAVSQHIVVPCRRAVSRALLLRVTLAVAPCRAHCCSVLRALLRRVARDVALCRSPLGVVCNAHAAPYRDTKVVLQYKTMSRMR